VRAHEDLDATRQRMHDRHVAHLLVTTPDGALIGVLNAEDSRGWLRSAWSLTRGGTNRCCAGGGAAPLVCSDEQGPRKAAQARTRRGHLGNPRVHQMKCVSAAQLASTCSLPT
jgi:hypothetical protein